MFEDIFDQVNDAVITFCNTNCKEISYIEIKNKWPLDWRSTPRTLYIGSDVIVIDLESKRKLDYYGGFEYVDEDYVKVVGSYVIYSTEHNRVQDVAKKFEESDE
jgi:methionine synthase II (cobalamin-independent)